MIVLLIRNSFFKKRNARLLSLISLHAMQIFILYEDRCDCSFDTEFFFQERKCTSSISHFFTLNAGVLSTFR